MGYMGFGMRKENYTRKPKSAFEKRQNLDKVDSTKRKSQTTSTAEREAYHEQFQSKYKWTRAKIASWVYWLFLLVVALIVIIKVLYL